MVKTVVIKILTVVIMNRTVATNPNQDIWR